MRLLSLTIRNFKGLPDFTFAPGGRNANISGANATGKTTIMDAWLWLLYGRDSLGQADFDVQPMGSHGQGVETEVTASIQSMEEIITLRKTYSERWTRKRGAAELSFDGHDIGYFVDSLPVGELQYKQYIAETLPDRLAKALTNPLYVNEGMKKDDRRKLIFELTGDLTDDEIIASDARLAPLSERGRHTVEDYKKLLQADRKRVNGELDVLPARIDEAKRAIGPECNITEAQAEKSRLQAEIKKLEAEASAPTDTETRLATLWAGLVKLEAENNAYIAQQREAWEELRRREVQGIKQRRAGLMDKAFEQQTLGSGFMRDSKGYAEAATAKRERIMQVKMSAWTGATVCPTCKRDLPAEDVEGAKRRFNTGKAADLEMIGKQAEEAERKASDNTREAAACEAKLKDLNAQIQECDQQIGEIGKRVHFPDMLDENRRRAAALKNEIEVLESPGDAAKQEEKNRGLRIEIEIRQRDIAEKDRLIASAESNDRTRTRIFYLQGQKQILGAELAALDEKLFLCDEFTRAKVRMVTERVNAPFRFIRWKLYDEQVNGGLADCCEAMVDSVPYSSLNHAARINGGIDIINALSRHFGYTAPLFIDNAEAVTVLEPTESQVIRLVVDGDFDKLQVEVLQ